MRGCRGPGVYQIVRRSPWFLPIIPYYSLCRDKSSKALEHFTSHSERQHWRNTKPTGLLLDSWYQLGMLRAWQDDLISDKQAIPVSQWVRACYATKSDVCRLEHSARCHRGFLWLCGQWSIPKMVQPCSTVEYAQYLPYYPPVNFHRLCQMED